MEKEIFVMVKAVERIMGLLDSLGIKYKNVVSIYDLNETRMVVEGAESCTIMCFVLDGAGVVFRQGTIFGKDINIGGIRFEDGIRLIENYLKNVKIHKRHQLKRPFPDKSVLSIYGIRDYCPYYWTVSIDGIRKLLLPSFYNVVHNSSLFPYDNDVFRIVSLYGKNRHAYMKNVMLFPTDDVNYENNGVKFIGRIFYGHATGIFFNKNAIWFSMNEDFINAEKMHGNVYVIFQKSVPGEIVLSKSSKPMIKFGSYVIPIEEAGKLETDIYKEFGIV